MDSGPAGVCDCRDQRRTESICRWARFSGPPPRSGRSFHPPATRGTRGRQLTRSVVASCALVADRGPGASGRCHGWRRARAVARACCSAAVDPAKSRKLPDAWALRTSIDTYQCATAPPGTGVSRRAFALTLDSEERRAVAYLDLNPAYDTGVAAISNSWSCRIFPAGSPNLFH